MPFVPIPLTVRSVLRFQQGTDERQMILHHKKDSGSITTQDLIDISTEIAEWWANVGRFASVNTLGLFEVTSTDISVPNGAQNTTPVSPPSFGNQGTPASPSNVTSTLSWRTANTGRRYRGRTFWPGWAEAATNDDSSITSAQLALLASAGANLLFGNTIPSFTLAVASKVLEAATPIIRVVTENILDSQRRRLPKRGI